MSVALGVAKLYRVDGPGVDLDTQSGRLRAAMRGREHGKLGDTVVSVDSAARTIEVLVTSAGETEDDAVPAGRAAIEQARGAVAGLVLTEIGHALVPRPPGWQPSGQ